MHVDLADASWSHDDFNEFIADYQKNPGYADFLLSIGTHISLRIYVNKSRTRVTISSKNRGEIERVFQTFEANRVRCSIQISSPNKESPVVFIGHGRSEQWMLLKNHLQDQHDLKIEAYETGARAGHTIRDILDEMANKSNFALLVYTQEDELKDGTWRTRQNVVHETGLFQGRLGFNRAIVLLEEGSEEFSNLHGIQQLRFSKGNIKEVFGDVIATIRREFG